MELDLNDDQLALRDMVAAFLEKEATVAVVREAEPLGFDAQLWTKIVELGLPSMTVPERHGGAGAGFLDLALAIEETGRTLAPGILVEAAVANHTLGRYADDGGPLVGDLLGATVAGEALATLAVRPAVDGTARLVPGGAVADSVIALDGDELVVVRQTSPTPISPAHPPPNLGGFPVLDRRLDQGDRTVLAHGEEAVDAHDRAVREWELLTAASLVGTGQRALELGLGYVMERRAFGVLIGTFQSLQHRLADDATALDGALLLAREAAWAHDVDSRDARELATMAFLNAGDVAFTTAAHCLQFHGGYGYTLEYDIQLYFRRARASVLVAGDPRTLRAELARRLYAEED